MEFLTPNKVPSTVIIDDEDWERVGIYKWYKYPSCRYVQAYINGKTTSISRFIMNAPDGASVDHINGDRLDNRKSNLRICSQALNMKNRKPNKNGQSSYKGVIVLKNGRYRAKINNAGARYDLGVYPSERDAVIAYNAAARVLHGEFAYMNEIPPVNTRTDNVLIDTLVEALDGMYKIDASMSGGSISAVIERAEQALAVAKKWKGSHFRYLPTPPKGQNQ